MKKHLKTLLPIAASLLMLSCTDSPEEYAQRWCELNHLVETSPEADKEAYIRQAKALEEEIKAAYGSNEEKMTIIYNLTDECD